MNTFGVYFTYWADRYDMNYDAIVERAARLGFQTLGIRGTGVVRLSREERDRTKRLADDRNIKLNYVAATSRDLASEDAKERRDGVDEICGILEAVKSMGGEIVGGAFYAPWKKPLPRGVVDKTPYMARSAGEVRKICARAADLGIKVNLEILNRYESYMLNTVDEALTYLDLAGADNLGLTLDTFHLNIEEASIADAIKKAAGKIGLVQVAEANRDVPGTGKHIPWKDVFAALRQAGYRGTLEIESFVANGTEIAWNICLWRDLVGGEDLDAKIGASLEFLRNKAAES